MSLLGTPVFANTQQSLWEPYGGSVAGPTGPAGATGPQGTPGSASATGPTGVAGATGAVGPTGINGAPGTPGATGPRGALGSLGPTGPQGFTGATGPTGAQGVPGSATNTGPTGIQGFTGPTGSQGAPGTSAIPTGAVTMYGGAVAPAGWLICNGGSYSATTYSALFGAIGTTYGGSGGFFNVPDFRSKVSRGLGPTAPYNALGNTGGADSVTLTANNIPAHVHPITDPGHSHDVILTKGYDGNTYSGIVSGTFSYIGMSEGTLGSRWTDPDAAVTTTTGITSTNPSVSPNNSFSVANSFIVLNFIIKT